MVLYFLLQRFIYSDVIQQPNVRPENKVKERVNRADYQGSFSRPSPNEAGPPHWVGEGFPFSPPHPNGFFFQKNPDFFKTREVFFLIFFLLMSLVNIDFRESQWVSVETM